MRKAIATALFVALVLTLFLRTTSGQGKPADIAGAWDMVQEGRNGPLHQRLTIQQTGEALKGSIKGPNDEIPITGSISGNKISFSLKFTGRNGEEIHEYEGTVTADAMSGTMKVNDRSIEWSAKRPGR
jgi:hypothetical protein